MRAGDVVRALLPDGTLGWSTVYAIMHRMPGTVLRHVSLTLAAVNRTLHASHEHLLPLARGGVSACAASAAEQAWLPAGAAAIGDALWAVVPGGGGDGDRLVCSPIIAVGEHVEVGFAAPLTFSSYIIVDGVAAVVWAAPFHPLAEAWRRRHLSSTDVAIPPSRGIACFFDESTGHPTSLWFAIRIALIDAPFRATYLALAAVRAVLPGSLQAAAAIAADDFTAALVNARLHFALTTASAARAAAEVARGASGGASSARELYWAARAAVHSSSMNGTTGLATALLAALAGGWLVQRRASLPRGG